MIKGVIFDWNGTLSNDIPKIFEITIKTVAKLGGKPPRSYGEYRRKVRNPYMLFYRDLGCAGSMADVNRWYCHYLAHSKVRTGLFPDAIKTLESLREKKVKIGIVSSHPTEAIKAEAKGYGIGKYLDFVRGNAHTKGHHIRRFLRRYRLRPREVIFVGDMANDIEEGKKCKVISAAYLRGVDTRKKLHSAKPDIVLPTLFSLKRHVKFVLAKRKTIKSIKVAH